MNEFGNVTRMEVVDENDDVSIFDFDYQATLLGIKLNLPAFSYTAQFSFPPFTYNETDFPVVGVPFPSNETSSGRRLDGVTDNEVIANLETELRRLQGGVNPAEVWIFLVECFQNVDPTELRVTASSDGITFPVSPERVSEGFYKAKVSVSDSEISGDVIGYACTGISLVGSYACPFVIGTSALNEIVVQVIYR